MRENKEKNQNKQAKKSPLFRFMLRESRGEKRWFLVAVLASMAGIAANFLLPQIMRVTVDFVIGGQDMDMPAFLSGAIAGLGGRQNLQRNLWLCGLCMVLLALCTALFTFLSRAAIARGTENFVRKLRNKLFRHIQFLPFKWHVDNQTGDIIQRCTSDLEVVRNFAAQQLLEVLRTLVLITIALLFMFSMNVPLSLIALAFIPLIALYSTLFFVIIGKRFLAADEAEGELTVAVQENLTGVRVVRAFGREKYELDRFDGYNNRFAQLWVRLGNVMSWYWGVGDIATGFQIASVVIAGAFFAASGQLTLGEYTAFVMYNQQLAWPVRALGRTLSEMSKTGVSAERIQEILAAEEEPPEPNAQTPNLHTDIRFENVTFSYDNQPVLKDLSFSIPCGSTFGILGTTGSGKSTITYLLNRLYDLPSGMGRIWFGDVEIGGIDRYYLRRNVGLVLQEPFLFSRTIEENIAIAAAKPRPDRIRRAATIAAVDEAISEFSSGYETMVGERGVTLSGGQKQRVAIARTLMLDAPVMIFDDSMSAVDLETDAQIREALRKNTGGATVILISHRINTLMAADQILVLEDGHMADLGTHAQLIQRPGLYQRIYNMQSEAASEYGGSLADLNGPARGGEA